MSKNLNKFDAKMIENILIQESKFINSLFQTLALPRQFQQDEETEVENVSKKKPTLQANKTSRAMTLTELKSRLDKLKTNNPVHKERLKKKEAKLKKKLKRDLKTKKNKPSKADQSENSVSISNDTEKQTLKKTVFNTQEKMLFSKIDFSGLGQDKKKKGERNPSKLLNKVKQVDEKVEQFKAAGETDKASVVKEKQAWKKALARVQGEKIKDDPVLLKKSIKKLEQQKRSRKKKWDARVEGVEKTKSERQQKRTENIEKRKKEKKLKKMKKAAKKGRIIPGL